ncbi:MAG: DUF4870 domain-containing protein [Bacteroidia bacterium]|nr:DUF4870 domain-containing protein [Bacteroidia bacterium]
MSKDANHDPFEQMTDEVFDQEAIEEVEEPVNEPVKSKPSGEEEKQWMLFAHLSALAGYVIPFGSVLGPLIIWLMKRDEMPLVGKHAKEALNFQLSIALYMIVSVFLILIIVGIFLLIGLAIFQLVAIIMAAVSVSGGKEYQYPMTIRFIK